MAPHVSMAVQIQLSSVCARMQHYIGHLGQFQHLDWGHLYRLDQTRLSKLACAEKNMFFFILENTFNDLLVKKIYF